jgi:small-conductance mechanosensitive channel
MEDPTFWEENGRALIVAAVSIVVALVIAQLVDRALGRRATRLAHAVTRGQVSRETETRLRFVRRAVYAVILLIGVAVALARFEGVNEIARGLLASGVVAAAIIGFAARQTLANVVAGIMLAVTQPIRVGDWITVEDNYGVVEDVRLNFTVLRTFSEQRIVIPNERLVAGVLRNDTLETGAVGLDVTLWLPADADVPRALEALREETGQSVTVAESAAEGTRLAVGGERVPPPERAKHEAELREQCLRRLRADGVLGA